MTLLEHSINTELYNLYAIELIAALIWSLKIRVKMCVYVCVYMHMFIYVYIYMNELKALHTIYT